MSDVETVLGYMARATTQYPASQVSLGWLLANARRVQFVARHGADEVLGMTFGIHRRIEIPMVPWMGYVRGVPVPDPLIWMQAAAEWPQSLIGVQVATDDVRLSGLLAPLLTTGAQASGEAAVRSRIRTLREEVDRALDLYNAIRHIMEEEPQRAAELEAFLHMAEHDMKDLGRQLQALKAQLDGQEGGPA
ncbi:MAG: hypothetical protein OWV35_01890 [Firmicutes bacterium]|nr:hypothetical protein [Bacillota bacterium]